MNNEWEIILLIYFYIVQFPVGYFWNIFRNIRETSDLSWSSKIEEEAIKLVSSNVWFLTIGSERSWERRTRRIRREWFKSHKTVLMAFLGFDFLLLLLHLRSQLDLFCESKKPHTCLTKYGFRIRFRFHIVLLQDKKI